MNVGRIRLLLFGAFFLASTVMLWWIFTAGPVTVYRTIAYNFSGIGDHRIFPRRRLPAAPEPFRFRETQDPRFDNVRVAVGSGKDATLGGFLPSSDTTAFLVVKDDAIVYEKYYAGHGRAIPSLSFSIAKSFLSLLVGCALDDGYLRSVDQPVTDFIPELADKGFSAVTLGNLLEMVSGVDYSENDFPLGLHVRFYYTDRLEAEILKLRLREPPGGRFEYKSADAYLLTLALSRALGPRTIADYTRERIWTPLGMEHDGSWSVDHAPGGLEKTGCCLAATARDFAKFGRLYLDKGLWNGRRIVSEAWVTESVRFDSRSGTARQYGYMWWPVAPGRSAFMAIGHLGQFLYVDPAARLLVVRLGKSRGGLSLAKWKELFLSLSDEPRHRGQDP
jgi:CubicO group peptidase (beta-lactamase class C family)